MINMIKKILLIVFIFCFTGVPGFSTNASSVDYLAINATEQVVYITKTGKKYHRGTCRYLSNSKIKTTKSKARELNYTACKVCKP